MKKITLKITLLFVFVLGVGLYSYAQNTARDGQTYRLRNAATGNYLAVDETTAEYVPAAFNDSDVTQVHRFMSNSVVVPGETYYTIDVGGPDVSRGVMRIAGAGANFKVFSTTKLFSDTSGMSDKVQNVVELGNVPGVGDLIRIQSKTADSYLREMDQAFFDANGFWYQGPALDENDQRQIWVVEDGTVLSTDEFDFNSIFVSNPFNNRLEIKGLTPTVKQVTLYSLLGREVMTKNLNGESSLDLDVSSLASGMYIMNFKGENGNFTKKVIKQ